LIDPQFHSTFNDYKLSAWTIPKEAEKLSTDANSKKARYSTKVEDAQRDISEQVKNLPINFLDPSTFGFSFQTPGTITPITQPFITPQPLTTDPYTSFWQLLTPESLNDPFLKDLVISVLRYKLKNQTGVEDYVKLDLIANNIFCKNEKNFVQLKNILEKDKVIPMSNEIAAQLYQN
jgi:hypothetical protein